MARTGIAGALLVPLLILGCASAGGERLSGSVLEAEQLRGASGSSLLHVLAGHRALAIERVDGEERLRFRAPDGVVPGSRRDRGDDVLLVVDGVEVRSDPAAVLRALDSRAVRRVRVVAPPEAEERYRLVGGRGVLIVETG